MAQVDLSPRERRSRSVVSSVCTLGIIASMVMFGMVGWVAGFASLLVLVVAPMVAFSVYVARTRRLSLWRLLLGRVHAR